MAPYETKEDATTRLTSLGFSATLTDVDVEAASSSLDRYEGPFIGSRYDSEQERAFPRSIEPDGTDSDGTVPEAILDAAALLAYEFSREDEPPVKSRGLIGASLTYERAAVSRSTRLRITLLSPYLLKVGSRL